MKKFNYFKRTSILMLLLFTTVFADAQTNESGWISLGDFLKDQINGKEYNYSCSEKDFGDLSIKKIAYKPTQNKINDAKSELKLFLPYELIFDVNNTSDSKSENIDVHFKYLYISINSKFQIKGLIDKSQYDLIPITSEGWKVVDLVELGKNYIKEKDEGKISNIKCAAIRELRLKKGLESDILRNIYVLPAGVSYSELKDELLPDAVDNYFRKISYVQPSESFNSTTEIDWDKYLQKELNDAKAKYPDISEKELKEVEKLVNITKNTYENNSKYDVKYLKENNGDFSSKINNKIIGALRRTTPEGIIEESRNLYFSLKFPNGDKLLLDVSSLLNKWDGINFLNRYKSFNEHIDDPETEIRKITFYPFFRLNKFNDSNDCFYLENLFGSKDYKFFYYEKGQIKPLSLYYSQGCHSSSNNNIINTNCFFYNPATHQSFNISKDGLKNNGIAIFDGSNYKSLPISQNVKEYRQIGDIRKYILDNGDYIGTDECKVTLNDGTIITCEDNVIIVKFSNGDSFTGEKNNYNSNNLRQFIDFCENFLKEFNINVGYKNLEKLIKEKRKIHKNNGSYPQQYVIKTGNLFQPGIYKTKEGKEYLIDNTVYAESDPEKIRKEKENKLNDDKKRQALIKKYGKTMVENCYKKNIMVGMPIDLIKAVLDPYIIKIGKNYFWFRVQNPWGGNSDIRVNRKTGKVDKLKLF